VEEKFFRHTANTLDDLSACRRECDAFLAAQNICEEAIYAVNLVLEEIITNTMKYGYKGAGGGFSDVAVELQANEILIEISDDAPEFDPAGHVSRHENVPFEERTVGGLGLPLVRSLMDVCAYRREAGRNIMSFTKRLS